MKILTLYKIHIFCIINFFLYSGWKKGHVFLYKHFCFQINPSIWVLEVNNQVSWHNLEITWLFDKVDWSVISQMTRDFGQSHSIKMSTMGSSRILWNETVNNGHLPLGQYFCVLRNCSPFLTLKLSSLYSAATVHVTIKNLVLPSRTNYL